MASLHAPARSSDTDSRDATRLSARSNVCCARANSGANACWRASAPARMVSSECSRSYAAASRARHSASSCSFWEILHLPPEPDRSAPRIWGRLDAVPSEWHRRGQGPHCPPWWFDLAISGSGWLRCPARRAAPAAIAALPEPLLGPRRSLKCRLREDLRPWPVCLNGLAH